MIDSLSTAAESDVRIRTQSDRTTAGCSQVHPGGGGLCAARNTARNTEYSIADELRHGLLTRISGLVPFHFSAD